jgi:tRNA G46 methylase TrmB
MIHTTYDRNYFKRLLHNSTSNTQRNRSRLKEVLARIRAGKLIEIGFGNGEFLKQAGFIDFRVFGETILGGRQVIYV